MIASKVEEAKKALEEAAKKALVKNTYYSKVANELHKEEIIIWEKYIWPIKN